MATFGSDPREGLAKLLSGGSPPDADLPTWDVGFRDRAGNVLKN